jgi:nickel/cobalt exporter
MKGALFYILSSFWAGAVHAATPGHGKTIAAAYIVGARGKPIDAVILGVFVTLSHTSGIVVVGALATVGSAWFAPQRTEAWLALAMGVLVLGLGAWMLWTQRNLLPLALGERRQFAGLSPSLAFAAEQSAVPFAHGHDHVHEHDHAHADGHAHHHHHEHDHHHHHDDAHGHHHGEDHAHEHSHDHHHAHDRHGETMPHDHRHGSGTVWHSHGWGTYHAHRLDLVTDNRPKLAVLLALSIAGGLLPDPAALAILLAALSSGRVMLGVATVLVFSLGFAAALVAVGVIAAHVGRRIERWLDSVWAVRVQLATTLLIIGMGVFLTAKAAYQLAPSI